MANKDRNKRSARKARAEERARVEAAHAVSGHEDLNPTPSDGGSDKSGSDGKSKAKATSKSGKKLTFREKRRAARLDKDARRKSEGKKPTWRTRIITYLSDTNTELHRVVWPSKEELKSYSLAVMVTLLVFGVALWLVDTGIVAILAAFTGLRG